MNRVGMKVTQKSVFMMDRICLTCRLAMRKKVL